MAAGDPVVLWVSGRYQPGVRALGRLLDAPARDAPARPVVRVRLQPLPEPVARSAWLSDAVLAAAEVVRMPAGSNPSYLTPAQADVLRSQLPPHAVLNRMVDNT